VRGSAGGLVPVQRRGSPADPGNALGDSAGVLGAALLPRAVRAEGSLEVASQPNLGYRRANMRWLICPHRGRGFAVAFGFRVPLWDPLWRARCRLEIHGGKHVAAGGIRETSGLGWCLRQAPPKWEHPALLLDMLEPRLAQGWRRRIAFPARVSGLGELSNRDRRHPSPSHR